MTQATNLKSLLAKLRNQARKQNLPAHLMLLFYFQERFLARVSRSVYRDKFILKGGLNLYGRYGSAARPTRDIDMAGQDFPNKIEAVRDAIKNIIQQDLNDDVTFDSENFSVREIIESANYKGIRV